MTKPQHFYLVALVSTVASGLTSLPRSPQHTTYSTALRYQDNVFIDVEVLSHQKLDILRSHPITSSESKGSCTTSMQTMSSYREIRIPLDWYPEQQIEDNEGPTACSAYQRKEIQRSESTVMVKVLEWKKRTGDVVTQGDIMVILQKSQIDFYGRTVNKQRIEVASKEDGILKTIVIPQNEELILSTQNYRSLLALFHPTSFHCIDIDEITRMDTALSRDDETQQQSKQEEMESPEIINKLLPRLTSTTLDMEQDDYGSYETVQCKKRTNATSILDDKKDNSVFGTDATPVETSQGESEGCDNGKNATIVEKQVSNTTGTDPTKDIMGLLSNTVNGVILSNQTQVKDDEVSNHERIIDMASTEVANQLFSDLSSTISKTTKAKPTDPTGTDFTTDALELLSNTNKGGLPSNQNQVEIEVSDYQRIVDMAAAEVANQLFSGLSSKVSKTTETTETDPTTDILEPSSDTNEGIVSSNQLQMEDEVSGYERIVDMAAAEVAYQLFSDLSLTIPKTTKAKATGCPSNLKLNKNATSPEPALPNNEAKELEQTSEKEALDEAEDDQQNNEEPWGSQKSQVFTVIVDFFTETFQKTE